jgi:hypothetical protein
MSGPWRTSAQFIGGFTAIFAVLYATAERLDPVYPQERERMELLRERSGRIEAMAIGNSFSTAIDFGTLGYEGFHLWQGGEDVPQMVYRTLSVVEELPRLRVVLASMSYISLQTDNRAIRSADRTALRRVMYARTNALYWIPGDADLYVAGKLAPVVRRDHWLGVALRMVGRGEVHAGVEQDGRFISPPPPQLTPQGMVTQSIETATGQQRILEESSEHRTELVRENTAQLERLVEALEARGVDVVFYLPPLLPAYTQRMDPALIEELSGVMRGLAARHSNVTWLNHSSHPALAPEPGFFVDGHHLNRLGARGYSAVLRECLRQLAGPRRGANRLARDVCGAADIASGGILRVPPGPRH